MLYNIEIFPHLDYLSEQSAVNQYASLHTCRKQIDIYSAQHAMHDSYIFPAVHYLLTLTLHVPTVLNRPDSE